MADADRGNASAVSGVQVVSVEQGEESGQKVSAGHMQDGVVLAVITCAVKYNSHVRPHQFHFRQEPDGFVYAYHFGGDTSTYGLTYGDCVEKIGSISYRGGERSKERCGSYSDLEYKSAGWMKTQCEAAARYYPCPAYGCVQCGLLDTRRGEYTEVYSLLEKYSCGHFEDASGGVVYQYTLLGYVALIGRMTKLNKNHPVLLNRCESCKKKYNVFFGHLIEKANDTRLKRLGSNEDIDQKEAIAYLKSIGHSLAKTRSKDEKLNAQKSICRRLRKKFNKLTKEELQFFRLMAGAAAINTMGGKYGTEHGNRKVA